MPTYLEAVKSHCKGDVKAKKLEVRIGGELWPTTEALPTRWTANETGKLLHEVFAKQTQGEGMCLCMQAS